MTRVKGLLWVLDHRESASLNLDLRTAAATAISCLKEAGLKDRGYSRKEPKVTDGAAEALYRLAIEWDDAALWCAVPALDDDSRTAREQSVKEAAKLFNLDIVRPACVGILFLDTSLC